MRKTCLSSGSRTARWKKPSGIKNPCSPQKPENLLRASFATFSSCEGISLTTEYPCNMEKRFRFLYLCTGLLLLNLPAFSQSEPFGLFDQSTDIGGVSHAGSTTYKA